MTLGVLSLALVVAAGAGVGVVLRDRGSASALDPRPTGSAAPGPTDQGPVDPDTVVVTDEEISALLKAHSEALTSGDAKTFTSIFDQKNAALVRDQARLFANLRKMPLTQMSYETLRRTGRTEDSFGRGVTFTQDVAFVHRFTRIDLQPVSEWYRWTIEKASADAPLVVTKVGGAPPSITSGEGSKTVYYPGPWDIWPDVAVVKAGSSIVLARPQEAALARRIAPAVAKATTADLAFWRRNGPPDAAVSTGFVIALAEGQAQLGNLFRRQKAHEAGVSIPMPSWGAGSSIRIGGSRIVLDTTSPFFDDGAGIQEVAQHEIAHSLVATLDSAQFSLFGKANWIVEGFADYAATRHQSVAQVRRFPEGRAYLAGRLARPFEGKLPDNVFWDYENLINANYFMGNLAMRFIAKKYGERKLAEGVAAAYRAQGDKSEAALFEVLGVSKAQFERQWAAYVRRQLA
ncbi:MULTISPECIES: hypothetical protein [Streptosporangium]|uniref:Peptidase MA-like domain-containing protein n=1 Tax=Streptosporangium brasiliense TaxID=47480 RepID=A0ABT9RJL4_9ACTN|nr:hypothetical protein [Streptosporangium brasiliense]MDP9869273.1 hypothetical protein [Streptosporangium brasiliense]